MSADEIFALHAPSVTLRVPQPSDAGALFGLASDPQVTQWFSWGPYERVEQAEAYIERLPDQRERGTQLDLLQVQPGVGPVGITGLSEFSYRDRRAMVGSWLGRDTWGAGVNLESKAAMAHLSFEILGLHRMGAYANTENGRSQRALEKVGFVKEGVLRGWHRHGNRHLDVAVYCVLASEWRQTPLGEISIRVEGEAPGSFAALLKAAS